MRDVLAELLEWWDAGETVGVGTVVATFQSAPRPPGASMLVGPDGTAVGSVSGGCVEGAVYELGQEVVESGDAGAAALRRLRRRRLRRRPDLRRHPRRLRREGRPARPSPSSARSPPTSRPAARSRWPPSSSTPTRPGSAGGWSSAPSEPVDRLARLDRGPTTRSHDDALGLLAAGTNATLTYGPDGERRGEGMRVFVWAFAPKPRMLVFGAIDFAAAVAQVGAFLGYHVTVCDARPVFATNSRFPEADEVVVDWPHRYLDARGEAGADRRAHRDHVLTHDPKFDVPLLEVALRLPEVAYVGAMGSRRTHDDRDGAAARGRARPTRSWPGSPARSASTSAPAPRRRPRSASPPRSSPAAGAAPAAGLQRADGRIHHD